MSDGTNSSFTVRFGKAGHKEFSSIQELQKWRDREREFWKWLPELRRQQFDIGSQLENELSKFFGPIDKMLTESRNLEAGSQFDAKAKQIASHIESYFNRQFVVLSEAPEGKFITELRQDNPRVAAYAASAMMGIALNPSVPESIEGHFLAIAYKHGYRDRTSSERESLQALQAEWRDLLNESKTTFEATSKQYGEFSQQCVEQLGAQKTEFVESKKAAQDEFKALVEKSEKELKNIEKTYDEKLALQAAVLYWKQKAASHSKAAKTLSWACGIVGAVVAILVGFETFLAIGPLQKLSDLPIWKAAMLLLTAVIGVWAIRVLVRLLLSNLHLKSEAVERRTMLLTYLALLRRGQGPSEEQRELILQILFRPSATGIVKDDALPPIVAKWLNTITS
jgi:hypothetical protein